MKRISIVIMTTAILLISLIGCTSTSKSINAGVDENEEERASTESSESTEQASQESEEKSDEDSKKLDVELKETTLLDENDVLVVAKSIDTEDIFGPSIDIYVENNSDKDIRVTFDELSINGFMIINYFSAEVTAGKKANEELSFASDDLEITGIENIAEVQMMVEVTDPDSYDALFDPVPAELTTSIAGSYKQLSPSGGDVLLDNEGVKITYIGYDMDGFFGPEMYYYIENTTEENVTVQSRDVSIDGFMVEPFFSCEVAPGKKAVESMDFMESDFEDNGIDAINNVELYFHVYETNSWNDIFDSEVISIGDEEADSPAVSNSSSSKDEVLVDQDDIKITYTGFDNDTTMGVGFKLMIENNSDKTITVQTRDESVNGFMVDGILSVDVAPGKKANDEISIWDSDLETSDIDEIKVFEFKIDVMEADNWDEIFETETITLTNSDAVSDTIAQVPEGQVMVDEAGIKIIYIDNSFDEYSGEQLRFYIENNTDDDISLNTEEVSVNGYMIDASMYTDILANKKAYALMTLWDDELEKNDIKKLKDMEFVLDIRDGGWNNILTTDTLRIDDFS